MRYVCEVCVCVRVCEETCVNMQPITWHLNWSCDQAL